MKLTTLQLIGGEVTDEDGDLRWYILELFYDDELDGVVDESSTNIGALSGSMDGAECAVYTADTMGVTLYMEGGDPEFNTLYEWGMIIQDGNEDRSEMAITTCYTPNSDGTDGGPSGG